MATLVDEADEATLENIKKDVAAFKTSATSTPNEVCEQRR